MAGAESALDFGYPWWLSYGHAAILVPAALALLAGWRRLPKWSLFLLGAIACWAGAGMLVARFVIDVNGEPRLPTESFLRSGQGRVLDIGAGTGRSSIMVLRARPRTRVVALDLFGDSFEHHFGAGVSPQERLLRNLKAAGVDRRATIETADMRKLPFEAAAFDAIVSAYAIDHLNRQGSAEALAEAARVLKPGGEFLLMLIHNEPWAKFAFGPLLSHGGLRGQAWWKTEVEKAGFEIAGEGTRPLTLYLLGRRR